MKAINFIAVFCLVLLSNGLQVFGQVAETPKPVEKSGDVQKTNVVETIDNPTSAKNPQNEKYRIGFQDTLEVQVFRHPELSLVVSVSPDGTILMPRIDKPIVAVCRTERELGAIVGTLYKSYLKNPFVSVRAVEQRSQPFAVIGAVEKPGSFYLNRKIRLLELLAFAGGPKTEKSGSKIQVARIGNPAGCAEAAESEDDKVIFLGYKINDVMNGKENPWMEPGDIVSVLEAEQAYVVGNVIKPDTISLKETVTLTQAIAAAGGLAPEAKTSKVKIQRQEANNPVKTELVYDLKDITSKKIPDPILQANDIVEVPKDGIKAVRNGFIKAISGGLGNIFTDCPNFVCMRNSKEIVPRQVESVEIERPFYEPQSPSANGGYGAYRTTNAQEGFQLVAYWRIIRKRFWLVIGIAVLMTTISAIYMARKPDIYQAKAVVQVDLEQANPDLVTSERRSPIINSDPSYFNTQLQLLYSDTLMRRVVKEFSLDSNKEFQKAKTEGSVSVWHSLLRSAGLASDTTKKSADAVDEISVSPSTSLASSEEINEAIRLAPYVELIKRNLSIEPVRETRVSYKDTRLIEVSFRHTDPELAAFVVNGIGEVFSKSNQEKRTGINSKTNDFLQNRVAQLQTEIKAGEEKLVDLTRKFGILKSGNDQTIVLSGLDILNKQLLDAENERKNAEAEYLAVNNSPESLKSRTEEMSTRYTTERENNMRGLVNDTQKKVTDLNAVRNRLLEEYQPGVQEVREVDTQIKALEDGLKKAIDENQNDLDKFRERIAADLLNNLRTKYLSAKGKEDKIRVSFNDQYNEAQGQNQSGVSLSILKQDIDTKKGFLKELLEKQRGNDVVAAGTDNNIGVAEIAIPPEIPIAPRRLTNVLGVLFLSTLFGMGLALFLEYLDDTIRTTEEIETYLGLPALAAIPRIDSLPGKRKLLLVGGSEEGAANPTNDLLIHNDSRSSLAEAYRQLRTSILLSTAGHAPKSLLVTSSLPSEGKTTTAINTAISLAQTGAKVLIIDADMRRPRLHSVFNISNAEGLSTLLSSEFADQDVLNVIEYDEESRLNLLSSGPVPPNPAELVGSEQMSNLLKMLQNNFTHVVVDSPPIASFTDGVLVASMVDGVILVVNSGKSSRQVVRRSRQLLIDIGAKIFGVVLNNVNLRSQDNYYYYQSYYHRDNYRSDDE